MAKVNISKNYLKDNGILLNDYNNKEIHSTESELIVIDKILYKLIHGEYIHKKQAIIEFFHDLDCDLPITLIDLLYDNNKLYGYSMNLLDDYVTLYEVLNSDISLLERKKIALEMIKIYEKLLDLKVVYFDWHSKNLMFRNDLKLLDIDSAINTKSVHYDIIARRSLFSLCLEVLIGVDIDFDYTSLEIDEMLEKISNSEDISLSKIIPLSIDYMKKEIDSYTVDKVDYVKELIIKM